MDPAGVPHSPDGEAVTSDPNSKYQRSLRSLHVLATRFVRLLQEAEGGELDLREAVRILSVGQKRRIYDITNVLEGVGLIVKMSKNIVKWMGTMSGEHAHVLANTLAELKSELEDLKNKEFILDQQTLWVKQSIRNTSEDCSNLTYVNHDDICNCFSGHTLLAVQAPSGTQLDVPIPKAVQNCPAKFQIHLKSVRGPIDVLLLNKHSVSSVPVVLPVPPSEEILQSAKSAMSTSDDRASSTGPCQASTNTEHNARSKRTAMEDVQPLHASSFINTEMRDLPKELQDLMDPPKALSPLLRLSPPPSEHEYAYNLDETEGLCDLFDIPVFHV